MSVRARLAALAVLLGAGTATAAGAQTLLSLEDVLSRARQRAPEIAAARGTLEETRARLVGAALRAQANPDLDTAVGTRRGPGDRFIDLQLGLSQAFEPPSRRAARIASATAAIARSSAEVDEATRVVVREAASSYYRALQASRRTRLLAATEDLAARIAAIAARRLAAGDVAVLDVNLAGASLAGVRAKRKGSEAAEAQALGDLKQWLLADEDLVVQGDLAVAPADATTLPMLLASAAARPELQALDAGVREAEADRRVGESFGSPDYGVAVRYERDSGDHVLLGGVTLSLPVFSKGQELRAAGTARASRWRAALDAARTRVQIEVRAAFAAFARRADAVRALEADALPGLDENDALSTRSYDVGQIGLADLLLIRRETLDIRMQYLDALLEAALARVALDASAAMVR